MQDPNKQPNIESPQPQPTPEPISKSHKTMVTALVVVVTLLAAGVVYLLVREPSSSETIVDGNNQLPIGADNLEQDQDETANWQTYRNEEYGFEVKYPEDLLVVDPFYGPDSTGYDFSIMISNDRNPFVYSCGIEDGLCSSNYAIYISTRNKKLHEGTLQEVISFSTNESSKQEPIIINGLNFVKAGNPPMYFIENNDIIYSFSQFSGDVVEEKSRKIYNQILSTFKFID